MKSIFELYKSVLAEMKSDLKNSSVKYDVPILVVATVLLCQV